MITVTNNSPQAINTSLFSLEKEIEASAREINKNIEDVSEVANKTAKVIEKINTEGMVVSVNNKQGIVTLDAADVGALPDTTTIPSKTSQLSNDSGFITSSSLNGYVPTSRTVNGKALSSNISLTASDVGALPDTTHIPADPVQSDWTETNTSSLAYIKNKPAIPVVPETFGVVLPYLYSGLSQYWFKVGTISYNPGSDRFPFCMFKLNIMGYYRSDNTGDFLIQCGIYDRTNSVRRLTRCDLVKTGNADCAIAVDDQMNVWIQPFSTYGSAFVLTYIGGRNFTFNVTRGNLATFGTASEFTPLITMTTAGSNTF